MRTTIFFSFTFAIASFACTQLMSQDMQGKSKKQNEKIVVPGKDGKSNMTIEIKDGEVFIDGKKVENDAQLGDGNASHFQKKIIVNGKDVSDDPAYQDFAFPFSDMDMQSSDKPMLGVNTKPTKNNDGAEIESVVPGSPAEKFGLKAGDIITQVGGNNIYTPKELVDAISKFKPKEKVDITFERGKEFITKNVELSERNNAITYRGTMPMENEDFFNSLEKMMQPFNERSFNNRYPNSDSSPKVGLSVEDRADGEGVLITEVKPESAAQRAGLQMGDVITYFGTSEINNVDSLVDAIAQNQSKTDVNVKVKRNGNEKVIKLTIPKNLKKRDL